MSAALRIPEFDRHPLNSSYYHSLAQSRYDSVSQDEIRQDFLFKIAEALAEPDKFDQDEFRAFPLTLILEYLANTHNFYLQKCLPEIEQTLDALSNVSEQQDLYLSAAQLLFRDLKKHLVAHIKQEEERLFPAIQYRIGIANNEIPIDKFSLRMDHSDLEVFAHEHSDDDEQTAKLLKALSQVEAKGSLQRILTDQIANLQNDLQIHAKIEEQVLIPQAKRLLDNK